MVRDTEVMKVDSSRTNRSEVWAEAGRSSSLPRSEHMTLQKVMKRRVMKSFKHMNKRFCRNKRSEWAGRQGRGRRFPLLM